MIKKDGSILKEFKGHTVIINKNEISSGEESGSEKLEKYKFLKKLLFFHTDIEFLQNLIKVEIGLILVSYLIPVSLV